jgi:hypothetical protein
MQLVVATKSFAGRYIVPNNQTYTKDNVKRDAISGREKKEHFE